MGAILINHVQQFRSGRKLTQEELARGVGVTRQTIIAIEKGNYTPSIALALKIAKYFKTSVEELFTIQEEYDH